MMYNALLLLISLSIRIIDSYHPFPVNLHPSRLQFGRLSEKFNCNTPVLSYCRGEYDLLHCSNPRYDSIDGDAHSYGHSPTPHTERDDVESIENTHQYSNANIRSQYSYNSDSTNEATDGVDSNSRQDITSEIPHTIAQTTSIQESSPLYPIQSAYDDVSVRSLAVASEESVIGDLPLTEDEEPYLEIKPPTKGLRNIESCIIVAVDTLSTRYKNYQNSETNYEKKDIESMTIRESLKELQELIRTAGLQVMHVCVQRLQVPLTSSYIGTGKVAEIVDIAKKLNVKTLIFDDDLTTKQQRNLEELFGETEYGQDIKILDRTAIILEIFAKRAMSREGQLQVELAMLEYRLTRGPRATGDTGRDSGAGFRGPGETKLETDKRVIKDKLVLIKKEIEKMKYQRSQHRVNRNELGLPIVTLCGYTNAGKSSLMNRMSKANVLAEDMLFATLDTTTRKVKVTAKNHSKKNVGDSEEDQSSSRQIMLTDTVGFVSKLPASLIAAFRSTLEEVNEADILVHVVDRSNPAWRKQRQTVLRELRAVMGDERMKKVPIVELWNKIDVLPDPDEVQLEAACVAVDIDAAMQDEDEELVSKDMDTESKGLIEEVENGEDDEKYVSVDVNQLYNRDTSSEEGKRDSKFYDNKRKEPFTSNPLSSNIRVIAGSAKTGLGLNDFYATLIDLATVTLHGIDIEVPYTKDNGIIAMIHSVGVVEDVQYTDTATVMSVKVPQALFPKLRPFMKSKI